MHRTDETSATSTEKPPLPPLPPLPPMTSAPRNATTSRRGIRRTLLRFVYMSDFAIYAVAIVLGAVVLRANGGAAHWGQLGVAAAGGLIAWSLVEYLLHRYILHGVPPFKGWHAEHHHHPQELIGIPAVASLALIAGLVFFPLHWWIDSQLALATTLGFMVGYLAYMVVHHGVHHWPSRHKRWFRARKATHALHHSRDETRCYGVTTSFWDRAFGTR